VRTSLEEAPQYIEDSSDDEATRLLSVLNKSSPLNGGLRRTTWGSICYARVTGISGKPLTDGYHFAKTIVNDYGRLPAGANFSVVFPASSAIGPLGFYVRGEFEHAPSAPESLSPFRMHCNSLTSNLSSAATPINAFNQVSSVWIPCHAQPEGWQTSFGKQTLWLGG